ncbi:uncharacterized protein LOC135572417 [Oncorhynchus nerka]|uniref:uncharacterized protein LOC135572417 n=1 Tax=Oncorhynchus nerka TaxID=8023 RepID=UPI0031B86CE1
MGRVRAKKRKHTSTLQLNTAQRCRNGRSSTTGARLCKLAKLYDSDYVSFFSMQFPRSCKLSSADWNSVARRTTNFRCPIRYNYRAPEYGYSDPAADDSLDTANAPETSLEYTTPSPLQVWSTPPLLPCRSGVHHPFSPAGLEYTTPSPLQVWSTPPLLPCRSGVHHPFSPAGLEYTTPSPLQVWSTPPLLPCRSGVHHPFSPAGLEYTTPSPLQVWSTPPLLPCRSGVHHPFSPAGLEYTTPSPLQIFWGLGGATPGKILLGLQVVTCDSSVLVRPNRVLVLPGSNVTLSASVADYM